MFYFSNAPISVGTTHIPHGTVFITRHTAAFLLPLSDCLNRSSTSLLLRPSTMKKPSERVMERNNDRPLFEQLWFRERNFGFIFTIDF